MFDMLAKQMKHGNKLKKKKHRKKSEEPQERDNWVDPYQITSEHKEKPWWWGPNDFSDPQIIPPPSRITKNHFCKRNITVTTCTLLSCIKCNNEQLLFIISFYIKNLRFIDMIHIQLAWNSSKW